MRLTRVYVDTPVNTGKRLVVEGGAANHITRVLRLRNGDALRSEEHTSELQSP